MAKSSVPAYGLMQIVPQSAGLDATEFVYGKPVLLSPSYLYNDKNNVNIGTAYLHILNYRYLKKIKNPVKAGLVKDITDYEWSSYKGYLSYAKKWNWLHKDYIFSMITPKKQGRLKPFIEFMQKDDSEEVTRLFSLKKLPSFFGPESFITGIKEKYYFKKKSCEVPESKRMAPTSDSIISVVCEHYDVSFNELLITRRGIFNEPRNIAVYLLRQIRGVKTLIT